MEHSNIEVNDLKISSILKLNDQQKAILFDYINTICGDKILDCLYLVIDDKIFREKFYKVRNTSDETSEKVV